MAKPQPKQFDALETPPVSPPSPPQAPVAPPEPTAEVPESRPLWYRVLEDAVISVHGQQTVVHVGDEVSDIHYGTGAIERMKLAHVKLEQVSTEPRR